MPKKKTQAEFLADAHAAHGDKYDYSKVDYKDSQTKVCIICHKTDAFGREHGEFWQSPSCHTQGQGCPRCSGRKKRTREEFIAQARRVHGDKYNYDKVVYVNDSTKVTVTCKKHGDFQITPTNHIHSGQGCKYCAHDKTGERSRLTQDEFITRATKVHDGKYNYDKVEYRDSHTRVIIHCPKHGDFKQLPYQHLNGHGCPKCATEVTILKESVSTEEFIKRAQAIHSQKYDYSQVVMNGMNEPVYIICPEHGGFWQVANTHILGHGCPICGYKENSRKRTKSLEIFIEEARSVHGDKYDYSVAEYVNAKQKLAIRCKVHDTIFYQKPNAHLNGNGCPLCAQSHLEANVMRLLKNHGIHFEAEKTFDWLAHKGRLFLDFFLPDYSLAIECQGEQHFHACDYFGGAASYRITKKRDELKKRLCEEHGIKIIYFSNLGIRYPYDVIEAPEALLTAIANRGETDTSDLWKMPELPLVFDE